MISIKAGDGPGGGSVVIDGATIKGGDTVLMSRSVIKALCDKWRAVDHPTVLGWLHGAADELEELIPEE